jgi:hypothetical protein
MVFDHDEFDASVVTKAADAEYAKALIDAELRQDILNLGLGKTTIKDSHVSFESSGMAQNNEEKVLEALRLLHKLAERLSRFGDYTPATSESSSYNKEAEMKFMDEDGDYYKG